MRVWDEPLLLLPSYAWCTLHIVLSEESTIEAPQELDDSSDDKPWVMVVEVGKGATCWRQECLEWWAPVHSQQYYEDLLFQKTELSLDELSTHVSPWGLAELIRSPQGHFRSSWSPLLVVVEDFSSSGGYVQQGPLTNPEPRCTLGNH